MDLEHDYMAAEEEMSAEKPLIPNWPEQIELTDEDGVDLEISAFFDPKIGHYFTLALFGEEDGEECCMGFRFKSDQALEIALYLIRQLDPNMTHTLPEDK